MNSSSSEILVIGKESVGKSLLVSQLTGKHAYSANYAGSTVACDFYTDGERRRTFVDAPGILKRADAVAMRDLLARLRESDKVLLVARATNLDDDLRDLLPLVAGKRAAVAVTFWDKITAVEDAKRADRALMQLSEEAALDLVPVDARRINHDDRARLVKALDAPRIVRQRALPEARLRHVRPRRTVFDLRFTGALLSLILLFMPALFAVWTANSFASAVEPFVRTRLKPLAEKLSELPTPLSQVFAGPYGLVTMTPLMFVWAAPVVVLYAFLLAIYKASGLIDRLTAAIEPLLRPFGLTGRDLVRVLMGFGCNVPAIVATRSCSICTRGTCISAIAFGAACSYQFGATVAVFAAAGKPHLALPYLAYLAATTLLYTHLTAPRAARSKRNLIVVERRAFLSVPRITDVWREARVSIASFFRQALPIFLVITVAASILDRLGVIRLLADALRPAMRLFNLPGEAATAILFASVRKDGILLFAEPALLATLTSAQILTAVYLAGVMLPCLVTAWTIRREQGAVFTLRLLARQLLAAVIFSLPLAWGGESLPFTSIG